MKTQNKRNFISIEGNRYTLKHGEEYNESCSKCALHQRCKKYFTEEGICQVFDAGFSDYFVLLSRASKASHAKQRKQSSIIKAA